jgi:hypothetical protein
MPSKEEPLPCPVARCKACGIVWGVESFERPVFWDHPKGHKAERTLVWLETWNVRWNATHEPIMEILGLAAPTDDDMEQLEALLDVQACLLAQARALEIPCEGGRQVADGPVWQNGDEERWLVPAQVAHETRKL